VYLLHVQSEHKTDNLLADNLARHEHRKSRWIGCHEGRGNDPATLVDLGVYVAFESQVFDVRLVVGEEERLPHVADGKNLWFYDRDLEQVSVKPATSALTATPAGLLSGEGNIRELFTVAPAGRKDGLDWVLVTPKENDADFREARLAFVTGQRQEGELKRMVLKDKLGQTVRLDFETSERNPPVAEAEVNFIPPAGADVIGTPAK
jgi:hypothetical protein